MRRITLRMGLLAVVVCSGCATWSKNKSLKKNDGWSISKLWKEEYQEPASLAAIWSPDTLATADQPTARGFGGRIYLYNDLSQAIPVEGDLLVHGYLTTPGAKDTGNVKADKRFEFSAEQLASHFSPSEIGASYSIWIPWDAVDGFREEVTLIPTFKSKNGTVIQGAAAKVFLPGPSRDKDGLKSRPMQQVSYTRESVATNPGYDLAKSSEMRTTTIGVPTVATLVRRQKDGYLLGSGKKTAGQSPTSFGAGVSVGGGQ